MPIINEEYIICDVCGKSEDQDTPLMFSSLYQCKKGHIFCKSEMIGNFDEDIIKKENVIKNLKKQIKIYKKDLKKDVDYIAKKLYPGFIKEAEKIIKQLETIKNKQDIEILIEDTNDSFEFDSHINLDSKYCPICQLNHIKEDDKLKYLIKKYNINDQQIIFEIKRNFGNFRNFKRFIK